MDVVERSSSVMLAAATITQTDEMNLKGNTMFAALGRSNTRTSILSSLLGALPYLRVAPSVAASRARLADMDDAMLADIGLTRGQARIEAARPIWDVPANWRA